MFWVRIFVILLSILDIIWMFMHAYCRGQRMQETIVSVECKPGLPPSCLPGIADSPTLSVTGSSQGLLRSETLKEHATHLLSSFRAHCLLTISLFVSELHGPSLAWPDSTLTERKVWWTAIEHFVLALSWKSKRWTLTSRCYVHTVPNGLQLRALLVVSLPY